MKNNNKEQREILRLVRSMTEEQRSAFNQILEDVREMKKLAEAKNVNQEQFRKALFIVDMNNGFVNFGDMHNSDYNSLVPEQQKLIAKFRKEKELVNFILEGHDIDAAEFLLYPPHCILNTEEAEVIPEYTLEQQSANTKTYYKNSINGALNLDLQIDLEDLKDLKELVICGVCTDLCVFDFARTIARYMMEINRCVQIFVVKSAISTFDAPITDENPKGHNKEIEEEYAYHMLDAAGIHVVENFEELEEQERELQLIP